MVCKILFFNYKDTDKNYFDKNHLDNFCLEFIKDSLNSVTLNSLNNEQFDQTVALSINENSQINSEVINKFKNLRVIATRSKSCSHIDLKSCINRNIAVVNVEDYKPECEYYNINCSFKAITSVLCGEKTYRII